MEWQLCVAIQSQHITEIQTCIMLDQEAIYIEVSGVCTH